MVKRPADASGQHRLVAISNVVTSLVNLTLSIALVRTMGLPGVAIGTLVPVSLAAMFILFPAGCARVGLPVRTALVESVWPALWPVGVMWVFVTLTLPLVAESLAVVAAEMAAAAGVYVATFLLLSVSPRERRFYIDKATALLTRRRIAVGTLSEGA